MKIQNLAASFLLILAAFTFTHCTKEQVEDNSSTTKEIITQGKWTVDYFFADQDITAQYSNYQFVFLGNGTVMAKGNQHELSGTWSMIRDVNYNDVIRINIDTQDPSMAELNDQWSVTNKSLATVVMQDGTSSQLRFKKL